MEITVRHLKNLIREALQNSGELETERLRIKYAKNNARLFADSFLKHPSWLDEPDSPVFSITIDLNQSVGEAYLNRGDAFQKGKGYGPETINALLGELKDEGYQLARGYVEHTNIASQAMLKKLGFKETDQREHGSYWMRQL